MRKFWAAALGVAMAGLVSVAPAGATPADPDYNFCAAGGYTDVTIKSGYADDPTAGVATSSSVFIPRTGGWFGIYFSNDGPGNITFTSPAFSTTRGGPIPSATNVVVPTTPATAGPAIFPNTGPWFWDGGWGGTFAEGSDFIGCVYLYPGKGTVHLDLSFTRGVTTYTERINVHYR